MKGGILRIQELLKEKGKSQGDLARYLHMRADSLSIALKKEALNVEKLSRVASFLEVPIQDLFRGGNVEVYIKKGGKTIRMREE
jgi:transcriptional regulator with XRE-family HTH domain